MVGSVRALRGSAITTSDGVIGSVEQVFFDDEKWAVRYLVVKMGRGFAARRVLVSPRVVTSIDFPRKVVAVRLSRAAVSASPDVDTKRPVSRQKELEYNLHFNFPAYWGGIELWGETSLPMMFETVIPTTRPDPRAGDVHLRSSQEVAGYHARATDEPVGRIADFLFDSASWKILYLHVETGTWVCQWVCQGKSIVPHKWVASVSWEDRELRFSLPGSVLRNAPGFGPLSQITPEAEQRVVAYFDCV